MITSTELLEYCASFALFSVGITLLLLCVGLVPRVIHSYVSGVKEIGGASAAQFLYSMCQWLLFAIKALWWILLAYIAIHMVMMTWGAIDYIEYWRDHARALWQQGNAMQQAASSTWHTSVIPIMSLSWQNVTQSIAR